MYPGGFGEGRKVVDLSGALTHHLAVTEEH